MTITDDSKITFGKHVGKKMVEVHASYLMWLLEQPWFIKSTDSYNVALKEYINDNMQALKEEVATEEGGNNER